MQSEMGFPSSHQLKSYVVSKSRLKLAVRCPVSGFWPSCYANYFRFQTVTEVWSKTEFKTWFKQKDEVIYYHCCPRRMT